MNRQPVIITNNCDNDGFLVITIKGKNADKVAEVIRKALDAEKKEKESEDE